MALLASAEERETRGFISMTTIRPSAGLTPNCTLEPPVSTPISRSTAIEASRMIWYSLSVSVSAGATVIEVAGVDAHRIEVLDRADDDAVVVLVANDLHLVLFPAEHALFDQHFIGGRGVDAGLDDVEEFFLVVGDAAAGAAQREARADDAGEADDFERLQRFDHVVGEHRARRLEADLLHGVAEQLAILGLVDGLGVGADHLDAELRRGRPSCAGTARS